MIRKKPKVPHTQRRFANPWGELDYLCGKIRYWLYTRKQKTRAEYYASRLEQTLHSLPENSLAIVREEGLALLDELKGRIEDAIGHRRREIQLMERLQNEAKSPRYAASTRTYMLQGRATADLEDRRGILAALRKAKTQQNDGTTGKLPYGSSAG